MTSGPENSIMIHRRRTLHRFKLREYAPLVNLFIFNFSAVQTSKTSFQIAEECTIKRPRFHFFSQQFQLLKHRFKLRQHAPFSNLFLKCSSSVPTSENIESIALLCTSYRPYFQTFLCSSNFERIVLNTARKHQLVSLFSKVSQQFQFPKHRCL